MDRIDKSEKSLQSEKKTIKSLELHGRKEKLSSATINSII